MSKVYIVQEEWNIHGDTGFEIINVFQSKEVAEEFCKNYAEQSYKDYIKDWKVKMEKLSISGYEIRTDDYEFYYSTWVSEYDMH